MNTCNFFKGGIRQQRRSVAQPGSASGLGPEGREFESLHSDQIHFVESTISTVRYAVFLDLLPMQSTKSMPQNVPNGKNAQLRLGYDAVYLLILAVND